MSNRISVWLDETSDATDPKWIVSEDDENGSKTLHVTDTQDRAEHFARHESERRQLPAVYTNARGEDRPLFELDPDIDALADEHEQACYEEDGEAAYGRDD